MRALSDEKLHPTAFRESDEDNAGVLPLAGLPRGSGRIRRDCFLRCARLVLSSVSHETEREIPEERGAARWSRRTHRVPFLLARNSR